MVVEKLDKKKITVSFSGSIGKKGLNDVKEYIEFLEANGVPKKKPISKSVIKKLSDEVNKAVAERFKKAKGIV